MPVEVQNIFSPTFVPAGEERLITLLQHDKVTIERIVSHNHSSPPGYWYDQEGDEWVIVLQGQATLEFEGEGYVELRGGDFLTIPRHVKHRVHRTDSHTLWLAVKVTVRT